ncbi:sulfite exporter TauE/SafE family protein [Aliidiomarina soli]|uniref:Probable membrane transporter protein n=1 Tax=Aliidiomarina soli TaxID=1928574 RepID=A0A432WIT7_9GAMM|nr:sulfite exporter TauE/SafE family protein [Aliidiomarina soli]RUO33720.1 sulfite exporter TauE/SafE family protein [Aliidiomarina soli]
MSWEFVVLGIFVGIAFTSESITGFGSIVIAVALGSLLFPIPQLLPILVPLSVFMSSALFIRFFRDIDFRLLFKRMLPFMLAGMLLGIALLQVLSSDALKAAFAVLVLWFALREWYKLQRGIITRPKPVWWQPWWTFCAGITHGLFASGGPLLVYSMNTFAIAKANFRATLVCVWLGLNLTYSAIMWQQGLIQPVLPVILAYLPVLAIAFWLGHRIHKRVNERQFKQIVYALLTFSAGAMLLSTIP